MERRQFVIGAAAAIGAIAYGAQAPLALAQDTEPKDAGLATTRRIVRPMPRMGISLKNSRSQFA
jgi:hypothetical protein